MPSYTPPPPAPVLKPASRADGTVQAAKDTRSKQTRAAAGRSSTIRTGGTGLVAPADVSSGGLKTHLGA